MLDALAGFEFRLLGGLGLSAFIVYLASIRKPSLFGFIMALLCVYLPMSDKFPFSFGFGINLLNISYIALLLAGKGQHNKPTEFDGVKTMGLWWFCICIFAMFFSYALHGDDSGNLLVLAKRLIDPVILYLFARRLDSNADRESVIDGMAFGTILFSFHLALQGLDMGHKIRVGGMMDQPNSAGAFIAAYSCLLLALIIFLKNKKMITLLAASLLVSIFAEFQTVSRAGALGLCAGLLVTALISGRTLVKIAILGITLSLLFIPQLLPDKLSSRLEGNAISNPDDPEAEVSADTRKQIWSSAISMSFSNPLGVGLGAFKRKLGEYGGPTGRDAHSMYLLVLSEMGVGGLLILLGLIFQMFKRGLKGVRCAGDEISRKAGLALTGGMTALVMTNFFSATMRDAMVFGYACVLAAIIHHTKTNKSPQG